VWVLVRKPARPCVDSALSGRWPPSLREPVGCWWCFESPPPRVGLEEARGAGPALVQLMEEPQLTLIASARTDNSPRVHDVDVAFSRARRSCYRAENMRLRALCLMNLPGDNPVLGTRLSTAGKHGCRCSAVALKIYRLPGGLAAAEEHVRHPRLGGWRGSCTSLFVTCCACAHRCVNLRSQDGGVMRADWSARGCGVFGSEERPPSKFTCQRTGQDALRSVRCRHPRWEETQALPSNCLLGSTLAHTVPHSGAQLQRHAAYLCATLAGLPM
jgi:hypothetical protein